MPKKLRKPNGSMLSGAEVLELARQAEQTSLRPPEHPLIGGLDLPDLPASPLEYRRVEVPPAHRKTYCESCGHVDAHAPGCPQATAAMMLEELDAEDAAEELAAAPETGAPEPITPLLRRIGASILRRFARIVEPDDRG